MLWNNENDRFNNAFFGQQVGRAVFPFSFTTLLFCLFNAGKRLGISLVGQRFESFFDKLYWKVHFVEQINIFWKGSDRKSSLEQCLGDFQCFQVYFEKQLWEFDNCEFRFGKFYCLIEKPTHSCISFFLRPWITNNSTKHSRERLQIMFTHNWSHGATLIWQPQGHHHFFSQLVSPAQFFRRIVFCSR